MQKIDARKIKNISNLLDELKRFTDLDPHQMLILSDKTYIINMHVEDGKIASKLIHGKAVVDDIISSPTFTVRTYVDYKEKDVFLVKVPSEGDDLSEYEPLHPIEISVEEVPF